MTIAGVVSRGYGNGAYDPGVAFVPTRGYTIGVDIDIAGPACWVAGQVYLPGFKSGQVYLPEFKEGQEYLPGFKAGQEGCN